jgi:hypothetical protein
MGKLNFNADIDVRSKLGFKPDKNINNGLCLGNLIKVTVETYHAELINENGIASNYEYKGLDIPRLKFEFQQLIGSIPGDNNERFLTIDETPIVSIKSDGTTVDNKKINSMWGSMWDRIIEIHNTFKNCPNFLPIDKKTLGDITIDPNDPSEVRIVAITKFFQFIANSFNVGKNGNAIYVDDKGKFILCWMKLLPNYSSRKYYTFPTYVNQGFIEAVKYDSKGSKLTPAIEIKPSESLELAASDNEPKKSNIDTGSELNADVQNLLKNL